MEDYFSNPDPELSKRIADSIFNKDGSIREEVQAKWDAIENRKRINKWIDPDLTKDQISRINNYTKEELIEFRERGEGTYSYCELVQKRLIEINKQEYVPKHTETEYFKLMMDLEITIEERHPQLPNGYYAECPYEVFSSLGGTDIKCLTKEHCLDEIFELYNARKNK